MCCGSAFVTDQIPSVCSCSLAKFCLVLGKLPAENKFSHKMCTPFPKFSFSVVLLIRSTSDALMLFCRFWCWTRCTWPGWFCCCSECCLTSGVCSPCLCCTPCARCQHSANCSSPNLLQTIHLKVSQSTKNDYRHKECKAVSSSPKRET